MASAGEMFVRTWIVVMAAIVAVVGSNSAAWGDTVQVLAALDTSLFRESTNSNALGGNIYTGQNMQGNNRRGMIAFDLVGNVPAGATITSVSLKLCLAGSPQGDFQERDVSLYRVLEPWGEGTSNSGPGPAGGQGASPTSGDATWQHSRYANIPWSTSGGTVNPVPSATTAAGWYVTGEDSFPTECQEIVLGTTSALKSDVQQWVNAPLTNHGWQLRGDETQPASVRRYYSREASPEFVPVLTVTFDLSTPIIGDANGDQRVDRADLTILLANYGMPSGATAAQGDFDGNGNVALRDVSLWQLHQTIELGSPGASVPEPATWLLGAVGIAATIAARRFAIYRAMR